MRVAGLELHYGEAVRKSMLGGYYPLLAGVLRYDEGYLRLNLVPYSQEVQLSAYWAEMEEKIKGQGIIESNLEKYPTFEDADNAAKAVFSDLSKIFEKQKFAIFRLQNFWDKLKRNSDINFELEIGTWGRKIEIERSFAAVYFKTPIILGGKNIAIEVWSTLEPFVLLPERWLNFLRNLFREGFEIFLDLAN